MSHMLCIGYGRFPPQNLTDLWLTIFRWFMVMVMVMVMVIIPSQHDGWSDMLRNVPWPRHQPHPGKNKIVIAQN